MRLLQLVLQGVAVTERGRTTKPIEFAAGDHAKKQRRRLCRLLYCQHPTCESCVTHVCMLTVSSYCSLDLLYVAVAADMFVGKLRERVGATILFAQKKAKQRARNKWF